MIHSVIEMHPDLSSYGWKCNQLSNETFQQGRTRMLTADFALQVQTALEAIPNLRIAKSGSYGLKHRVEAWVESQKRRDLSPYISNGAMIVAMIADGWEIKREPNHINCGFRRQK